MSFPRTNGPCPVWQKYGTGGHDTRRGAPDVHREADRAYRKAWRKNNPAWYTRLWRFLAKKR